ncbi:TPA: type IV pilin [Vibrio parahaemolyticus]|nr:type IV pilin [Vibrio parahaemolyticus]
MRWLSGFSLKEWLFAAVLLGGISAYALHHSNQRTSNARSAAIQVLFADMQYYVSILNGYPETQSECGEHLGFFDNMTISDEMKQANLVFIENNTYSIVGYGRSDSPEALMQGKCYAYYRLEGAGKDGHSFKVDASQC